MFVVTAVSPLDDNWQERDQEIYMAAGRLSNSAGAGYCHDTSQYCQRDHQWIVDSFFEAVRIKKRLQAVESVRATISEFTSHV